MQQTRMNEDVAEYYRSSDWLYKNFWYSQRSLGMHFGFWEDSTKTNDEAIINQYKYIIKRAKIQKKMLVLDAGCGVGGAAIYISKNTGARSIGITITPEQVVESKSNAKKHGVDKLVEFRCMDFMKTDFSSNTFDVVFGIESICHAYSKKRFLREAMRILKPGGILLISDGYVKREPTTHKERELRDSLCNGWHLQELINYQSMEWLIREAGFINIEMEDKANEVRPTLQTINKLVSLFWPIFRLAKYLKIPQLRAIFDNVLSLTTLAEGDKIGLFGYYSMTAKKPSE